MACHWSLQLNNSFYLSKSSGSKSKRKIKADAPSFSKLNGMELGVSFFSKNSISLGFVFARYTSRYVSLRVLSSMSSSASTGETNDVNEAVKSRSDDKNMDFTQINCLVWVLHESATSFSQAVESLELAGRGAELAMAWKGKGCPFKEIFTPKINLLGEYIENQLNMKHSELVQWFKVVELPHITGFFAPLLKQWSIEYAGSGIAGIIVAISCCAAVGKLGSERISCPLFTLSLEDQKLSLALGKEIDIRGTGTSCKRARADSLATLGLFAHLGRKTRLFLSRMGMKDLDELILDLLGYLECGCLFVYPELASVSTYQCFMEVVTDEIGWLDFYATCSFLNNQERESRSAQLPLDADLLAFLLRSQNLLTVCLEDYWAVYDRSCEQLKIVEASASDLMPPIGTKGTENIFLTLEAQQRPAGLILKGCLTAKSLQSINLSKASCSAQTEAITHVEASSTAATKPNLPHDSLLRKYSVKLVSTSSDLWMGTQLLVVDISFALNLLLKQLQGHKVTVRERKKLKRTLNDIITLIPSYNTNATSCVCCRPCSYSSSHQEIYAVLDPFSILRRAT
ncbi:hypothetical protein OIU77_023788 [Salix suchowensis]|uniref:Uncharacterized protein n=1 Tax=Salix suchowensis TaxID=1278906 RepID=A0ABQ9C986_9ROSI|nr:hypothetical protein OIU77_023788 [Salix suchowensis]